MVKFNLNLDENDPNFYKKFGDDTTKDDFEMSVVTNSETQIEENKENNIPILNPGGEARRDNAIKTIIKITVGIYLAIIFVLLWEFIK